MPSTQRRVSNFPAVGRDAVTACYTLSGRCRAESLRCSVTDMDNWFPVDVSARMSSTEPPRPMGSNVDALSSISDYQAEVWWPTMTPRSPPQVTKRAMEAWCEDEASPVDLNAPSEQAIAVVSVVEGGRKASKVRKSVSAPTSPSSLGVQKPKWNGKRPVSQRENHIWSERQRRKGMNYLFSTLRSLLPHPTSKTDKSTVVGEIIKYIQSLQVKLEELTRRQQQLVAVRTLSAFHSVESALPRAFVSNGLTLVDHSGDPASATAVTALPPPGRESCLASYLGSNVGLHVCGLNVFITTSSPRGRHGLLQQLLVTIHKHHLDVINANISTSNASVFHCLHCQASQNAEFLNNALHSALQSVINNFA